MQLERIWEAYQRWPNFHVNERMCIVSYESASRLNRSKTKTIDGDQMPTVSKIKNTAVIKVFSWRGRKADDNCCCAHGVMRAFPSSNRKNRVDDSHASPGPMFTADDVGINACCIQHCKHHKEWPTSCFSGA